MKKTLIAAFLAVLAGCARPAEMVTEPARGPAPSSHSAKRLFLASAKHDLSSLRAAASALASGGIALETPAAERCLQEERERGEVARLCLFLWSLGEERSAKLETQIAEFALSHRIMAIAAIKHEHSLLQVPAGSIPLLLAQLSADPVWLRAKAMRIWGRQNTIPELTALAAAVRAIRGAGPESPADFRELYLSLHTLSPAEGATLVSQECHPGATGELRMRCWRFLSAFIDPATGYGLPAELQGRATERGDAWNLFRLSSPFRARLIERQFNR